MLPINPRFDPPTPDDVRCRLKDLVSTLLVLRGMTQRGAVLPDDYRDKELPAIRRLAERVLNSLEKGEVAHQPWDHKNRRESSDAA